MSNQLIANAYSHEIGSRTSIIAIYFKPLCHAMA